MEKEGKTESQSNVGRVNWRRFCNLKVILFILVLAGIFSFYSSRVLVTLLNVKRQSGSRYISSSLQVKVSPKDLEKLEKFSGKYIEFEYPRVWSVLVKEDECQNYFSNYRGFCSLETFNQNGESLALFYPSTGIGGAPHQMVSFFRF